MDCVAEKRTGADEAGGFVGVQIVACFGKQIAHPCDFFGLLAERKVCVRAAASLEVIGAAATGLCNLTWWYMELVAAQLGSAHAPS